MKHATSRFFRFFLVAALVAAMAGSLLPAKVAGQVSGVMVSATPGAVNEASEWVITFTTTGPVVPDDDDADTTENSDITLTFTGAAFTDFVVDDAATTEVDENLVARQAFAAHITVSSGDASAKPSVVTSTGTSNLTFETPVAIGEVTDTSDGSGTGGTATITIVAAAGIVHATPLTATSVEVDPEGETAASGTVTGLFNRFTPRLPTSLNAGQVARWDATSENVAAGLIRNQHEITVSFTSGTVPSVIDKNSIRLISSTTAAEGIVVAGSPSLNPSVSVATRTIRFLSPVDVTAAADATLRVIISEAAGIAAPAQPAEMAIRIQAGELNPMATSTSLDVGRYVNFSPSSAKRGTTVTVTGGGFTAGTSGDIMIGEDPATSAGGTYDVDSAGKLTGSFVVNGKSGKISVTDLGARGADPTFSARSFTTAPSATPDKMEVTQGSSVTLKLQDFGEDPTYTLMLAGRDVTENFDEDTKKLTIDQSEGLGTKQVSVTANSVTARFSITIVPRSLVVTPSSAVPGQTITVSGAGFNSNTTVDLVLQTPDGADSVDIAEGITVNIDGTFLYTGKVPFDDDVTFKDGPKEWMASEGNGGRAATSSGFSIQKRTVTLSPSTANPGTTVEVFGAGWGVRTHGDVTSEVKVVITDPERAEFGPFPIGSTGEFQGAITVPANAQSKSITVTVTDNNGGKSVSTDGVVTVALGKTGGFADDASKTANLRVPTGVVTVSPSTASTGAVITVTGTGFPAQTNLSTLKFGPSNALPVPAPATDVNGTFTVTLAVPAATGGGSLAPGAVVITARVGQISGTTSFTIPGPSISLSASSARPGDTVTVSGTNFSAYANVDTINVGQRNQRPSPAPLTDGVGSFSAEVLMPALNPGAYTITVRTGAGFTATAPINIVSATVGNVVPAEQAFQALTSRGILTLAAAAAPGGTSFGAFVPGLAGNTLVNVEPNGVLILTLNADARISVSNQPAVDVAANTPTFFALGSTVSVEVVE